MKQYFSNLKLTKRRLCRLEVIIIVYQFQLLDLQINYDEIFENFTLDDYQNKLIITIEKNKKTFIKLISNLFIKDWCWEKINPLIQAILLCGCVELRLLDKKIVINEYVEITKMFFFEKEYMFVNKILDKMAYFYEKQQEQNQIYHQEN